MTENLPPTGRDPLDQGKDVAFLRLLDAAEDMLNYGAHPGCKGPRPGGCPEHIRTARRREATLRAAILEAKQAAGILPYPQPAESSIRVAAAGHGVAIVALPGLDQDPVIRVQCECGWHHRYDAPITLGAVNRVVALHRTPS